MSRHVAVDFACNDPDNGAFAGRAGAASVFGNDLELDPKAVGRPLKSLKMPECDMFCEERRPRIAA